MLGDLSDQEQAILDQMGEEFDYWLNDRIVSGDIKVYTLFRLMGQLWLRMRGYMHAETAIDALDDMLERLETALADGTLEAAWGPGYEDTIVVRPLEYWEEHPEVRQMMDQVHEIPDDLSELL